MSAKLLIDAGVELLHHEDQDDILPPRVCRTIVLYVIPVLGCTIVRVREFNLGGVRVQRSRWGYS